MSSSKAPFGTWSSPITADVLAQSVCIAPEGRFYLTESQVITVIAEHFPCRCVIGFGNAQDIPH